MDVISPCVYVIVSRCFDCAAVDTSRDIGEFHFPVVVENMTVQMGKERAGIWSWSIVIFLLLSEKRRGRWLRQ